MARRTKIIAASVVSAVVLAGWFAFPIYPSRLSLCELIDARGTNPDRWATPHRGAALVLHGTLVGGPDGMYAFRSQCHGSPVFAAVEITPMAVMSLSSRKALGLLAKGNWQTEDTAAPATVIARVSSEVQSCFGPGLMLTALSVRIEGPVSRTSRRRPNSAAAPDAVPFAAAFRLSLFCLAPAV